MADVFQDQIAGRQVHQHQNEEIAKKRFVHADHGGTRMGWDSVFAALLK